MHTADVSVVIPFFNSSSTLARALDSVAAQTLPVREVVVVDDCSTEAEARAAAGIVARMSNARLVSMPRNGGPGEARNAGWQAAEGHWVAFLDSDDAWHPRKVEAQLRAADALRDDKPVLIASQCGLGYQAWAAAGVSLADRTPATRLTKRGFLLRNQVPTSSVMVARDLPHRFPAARRYSEDWELWLSIAALGRPMLRVEFPYCIQFKAVYGESGLSGAVWKMIRGEYRALWAERRAGRLSLAELGLGLASLTVRVGIRLARLGLRRARVS
ncbi:glycosyltransferase family 2 protein [Propionibacteriaceae bacterium G57]|uniref:glycosyltransferase family 2 protein n=1 Tax=Aestuariimicrobium sp. G57 TaxID=3418485 RepID=UPI003DA705E8